MANGEHPLLAKREGASLLPACFLRHCGKSPINLGGCVVKFSLTLTAVTHRSPPAQFGDEVA
jgi:hypothetical protein